MVGRIARVRAAFFPVVLVLIVLLGMPQALEAQEIGEEGAYALQEEYRIEINAVGDATITDTITYEAEWFDEYGYLFEENPNLLTRRYRADSNVGEVESFDVDINSRSSAIIVTFRTPGLAYRLSDGWTLFGYGDYEIVEDGGGELRLQAAWSIANEFSLFEPMYLEQVVIVDLPDGARNAAFDAASGAIEYDLEYIAEAGGFLADNRTVFVIVFALVMGASLILMLYVFTRKAVPAAVAVQAGVPAAAAEAAQPAAEQPQRPAPPAESGYARRFCKKCGEPRGRPGDRFCRKCGSPYV